MRTFWLGTVIALALGIITGVVYTTVGIGTAEYYGTEYVQLPEDVAAN